MELKTPATPIASKKTASTSVSVPHKTAPSAKPTGRQTAMAPRAGKRPARRHAVREPKFITVRKERKERKPFPLGIVLVLTVITVLFLFMMMNYAEIDQYNSEIRDLRNQLGELQNQQKKLEVRLENKDDRAAFEQYAIEELGMVKADSLNKYIITLSPDDKTEIMEYEEEKESGFGYLLSGLSEVVRGFFGS